MDRTMLRDLQNADVFSTSGDKIGSVGQVYLDDRTEEPTFITVKTGLFGTKETFVPLDKAQATEGGITVPFEKDFVKDAPNVDADGTLTPDEERRIYEYYSMDYEGGRGHDRDGLSDRRHDDRDGLVDRDRDGRIDDDRDHRGRDAALAGGAAGAAGAAGAGLGRDRHDDRRDQDFDGRRDDRDGVLDRDRDGDGLTDRRRDDRDGLLDRDRDRDGVDRDGLGHDDRSQTGLGHDDRSQTGLDRDYEREGVGRDDRDLDRDRLGDVDGGAQDRTVQGRDGRGTQGLRLRREVYTATETVEVPVKRERVVLEGEDGNVVEERMDDVDGGAQDRFGDQDGTRR